MAAGGYAVAQLVAALIVLARSAWPQLLADRSRDRWTRLAARIPRSSEGAPAGSAQCLALSSSMKWRSGRGRPVRRGLWLLATRGGGRRHAGDSGRLPLAAGSGSKAAAGRDAPARDNSALLCAILAPSLADLSCCADCIFADRAAIPAGNARHSSPLFGRCDPQSAPISATRCFSCTAAPADDGGRPLTPR